MPGEERLPDPAQTCPGENQASLEILGIGRDQGLQKASGIPCLDGIWDAREEAGLVPGTSQSLASPQPHKVKPCPQPLGSQGDPH